MRIILAAVTTWLIVGVAVATVAVTIAAEHMFAIALAAAALALTPLLSRRLHHPAADTPRLTPAARTTRPAAPSADAVMLRGPDGTVHPLGSANMPPARRER